MTIAVKDDVLRFVLPAKEKKKFQKKCEQEGQKMSERMRYLVDQDIAEAPSAATKLASVLSSAKQKAAANALPTLSIEEIDVFIDQIREERIAAGHVQ